MNNIIANIRTQLQKLKCRIANLTKRVTYIEDNCCNGGGGSGIQSIQEGDNISIDNTDPQNPIISALGGGGGTSDDISNESTVTGATVTEALDELQEQFDVKVDNLEQQIANVADGTAGKAYPDLLTAMSITPLPEDGIIFTIDETNETEKGVYRYDSTVTPEGYVFVRHIGATGVVEEGNTQAVSGGEVYDYSAKRTDLEQIIDNEKAARVYQQYDNTAYSNIGFISNTGSVNSNVNYRHTDPIFLKKGEKILVKIYPAGSGAQYIGVNYDSYGVFIGQIGAFTSRGAGSLHEVEYEADEDGFVVINTNSSRGSGSWYSAPIDSMEKMYLTPEDAVVIEEDEDIDDLKYISAHDYTIQDGDHKRLLIFEAESVVVRAKGYWSSRLREVKCQFLGDGLCIVEGADGVNLSTENRKENIVSPNGYFSLFFSDVDNASLSGDLITGAFLTKKPSDLTNLANVLTVLTGALTTNGFDLKASLDDVGTTYVTVYSNELRTEVVTYSSLGYTNEHGIAHCRVRGLEPNTKYYWSCGLIEGEINTAPTDSNFKFISSGCGGGNSPTPERHSNHPVYKAIADNHKDALFFLHNGDFHYWDYNQDDVSEYLRALDQSISQPNQQALYAQMPLVYMVDDHDFTGNDSQGDSEGKWANLEAYKHRMPTYPYPFKGQYGARTQTFVIGNVRFITLDNRSNRITKSQIIGREQVNWLKRILATASEDVFVLQVGVPWISGSNIDDWSTTPNERQAIMDAIAEYGLTNNVMIISGDAHMLAYDDGTNNNGVPVLQTAALDSPGTIKGGPYSGGTYPGFGQYGEISFEENAAQIVMTFKGVKLDGAALTQLFSFTKTFPKRKLPHLNIIEKNVGKAMRYLKYSEYNELESIIEKAEIYGDTMPSDTALSSFSDFVGELSDKGIWSKLDRFYNFAWNDINVGDGFLCTNLVNGQRHGIVSPNVITKHPSYIDLFGDFGRVQLDNHVNFNYNDGIFGAIVSPSGFDNGGSNYIWSDEGVPFFLGNSSSRMSFTTGVQPTPDRFIKKPGLLAMSRFDDYNFCYYTSGDYIEKTNETITIPEPTTLINIGRNGQTSRGQSAIFVGSSLTENELNEMKNAYNKFLVKIGLEAFA